MTVHLVQKSNGRREKEASECGLQHIHRLHLDHPPHCVRAVEPVAKEGGDDDDDEEGRVGEAPLCDGR